MELGLVALVAAAEHKKAASERNVEEQPKELVEIGIELRWAPATVTVDVAGDEEAGLENFAVAPVKPEAGPEAEVVVAQEVASFLAFASAAEEVQDSALALAVVDVVRARPVPVDANADAEGVALAFGAVDVAEAWPEVARGAGTEAADAAAALAEEAGAIGVQRVEPVAAAAEQPALLE